MLPGGASWGTEGRAALVSEPEKNPAPPAQVNAAPCEEQIQQLAQQSCHDRCASPLTIPSGLRGQRVWQGAVDSREEKGGITRDMRQETGDPKTHRQNKDEEYQTAFGLSFGLSFETALPPGVPTLSRPKFFHSSRSMSPLDALPVRSVLMIQRRRRHTGPYGIPDTPCSNAGKELSCWRSYASSQDTPAYTACIPLHEEEWRG